VFFDTPGEDLKSRADIDTYVRYAGEANALLLVVDPLQLPTVRDLLGNPPELPDVSSSSEDIAANITQFIRSHRNVRTGRISTPIAVAFTKIDALQQLLSPTSVLRRPSNHDGQFDQSDALEVNDEVRSLLDGWGAGGLTRHLDLNYERHCYFAVSALGRPPVNGRAGGTINAFRAEDPLLWCLAQLDVIRTNRASK
jgi:hypothetical protein